MLKSGTSFNQDNKKVNRVKSFFKDEKKVVKEEKQEDADTVLA